MPDSSGTIHSLVVLLTAFTLLWSDCALASDDTSKPEPANGVESAAQGTAAARAAQEKPPVPHPPDQSGSAAAGPAQSSGKAQAKSDAKAEKKRARFLDTPPCLTWLDADTEPKAVILCVHGLGLHNGTYKDFGERMAKQGYIVYAVDVRGFGSWKAARGRQKVNFEECLEDVHKTLKVIHKVHPQLPVFLLGESMGGAIALRITSMYPELVDGLISSVPAGDRFKQGQTTLKVALKLLTAPNKEFDVGTGVINQATKKDDLRKMWSEDPLARMNLSPKELVQFQSFMNDNHRSVKLIKKTPVLMVQGCEDKLVKPKGTLQLFDKIVSKDKQMLQVAGAEHLIFEEGQFDDYVIKQVDDWLLARLKKTGQNLSSK